MSCQSRILLFTVLALLPLTLLTGCGPDRTLHPVTGKVTLGGQGHARLLVYFRPIDRPVNDANLGVGETDAAGVLTLRSTAGDGLVKGAYRVSFSCPVMQGNPAASADPVADKGDDRVGQPAPVFVEKVPEPYTDAELSPVTFEIKPGANRFEFDIPSG